jgi:SAM-dependent methyltransferase
VHASQADYDAYYARLSNYEDAQISSGSGLNSWDHRRLSATADELQTHLATDAHVLDVGSAQGGLLQILADRGFRRLSALEPSKACVSKLASAVRGYVGSVHNLSEALSGERVDAIILSHVLEHIYDIEGAIMSLSKCLSKEGLLYVEVPDAARYTEFFKTSFHYFDVEHINHFDLASLQSLFGIHGFEVVAYGRKEMEISDGELYPAIFSMFRRKRIPHEIAAYIDMSKANDNSKQFAALAASEQPVAIWGFGSYTKRLLATTDLAKCNVRHIVDGDAKKHGTAVGSLQVEDPANLRSFDGIVLIASALYSGSIKAAAAALGLENETIVLR